MVLLHTLEVGFDPGKFEFIGSSPKEMDLDVAPNIDVVVVIRDRVLVL